MDNKRHIAIVGMSDGKIKRIAIDAETKSFYKSMIDSGENIKAVIKNNNTGEVEKADILGLEDVSDFDFIKHVIESNTDIRVRIDEKVETVDRFFFLAKGKKYNFADIYAAITAANEFIKNDTFVDLLCSLNDSFITELVQSTIAESTLELMKEELSCDDDELLKDMFAITEYIMCDAIDAARCNIDVSEDGRYKSKELNPYIEDVIYKLFGTKVLVNKF